MSAGRWSIVALADMIFEVCVLCIEHGSGKRCQRVAKRRHYISAGKGHNVENVAEFSDVSHSTVKSVFKQGNSVQFVNFPERREQFLGHVVCRILHPFISQVWGIF